MCTVVAWRCLRVRWTSLRRSSQQVHTDISTFSSTTFVPFTRLGMVHTNTFIRKPHSSSVIAIPPKLVPKCSSRYAGSVPPLFVPILLLHHGSLVPCVQSAFPPSNSLGSIPTVNIISIIPLSVWFLTLQVCTWGEGLRSKMRCINVWHRCDRELKTSKLRAGEEISRIWKVQSIYRVLINRPTFSVFQIESPLSVWKSPTGLLSESHHWIPNLNPQPPS